MPDRLLRRNAEWAEARTKAEPGYFQRLAAQQRPDYFWIGCCDSRVPANVVAGLDPGEVFVHRNIANVVHSADLNLLSALEFAIDTLLIRTIIVCGHYGCAGIKAATEDLPHGLADHWLEPVRRLTRARAPYLAQASDETARQDMLAEFNVMDGVARVAATPMLQRAWARGDDVSIHGMIYGLSDGRLRDLGCTIARAPRTP